MQNRRALQAVEIKRIVRNVQITILSNPNHQFSARTAPIHSSRMTVRQPYNRRPCAACKNARARCDEYCILAPYFPAEREREYLVVHRVFGTSNMTRMILRISESDRNLLVESLVREAFTRQSHPVLGMYGEYARVSHELHYWKDLAQKKAAQILQMQTHIERISVNNAYGNESTSGPSDPLTWYGESNPAANLGRARQVEVGITAVGTNNNNPMTNARESGNCIIDSIPYTSNI
ncbi:hypothetical protein MLD38_025875 [Melastoma candidum]|uniref:Uncharacterized protein n=1 Tax=Melastoma candidum TaxID=119954 RepID=A0ACB9NWH5_9MYRT|nr:hypothetical protein MLD38_025875 [Melastoma candidum]